jgi:hypothetical protein
MSIDRKFLLCAFAYAIIGLGIGVYMGASQNHSLFVAHAHILLVGFVVSFLYALVHRLWIPDPRRTLAILQFYLHQVGAFVLLAGLLLLYGQVVGEPTLGPILGVASIAVLAGAMLMAWMILRSGQAKA